MLVQKLRVFNLYLRTIKHLKPSQIYFQIRWRISSQFGKKFIYSIEKTQIRKKTKRNIEFIFKPNSVDDNLNFYFLNESHNLKTTTWEGTNTDDLWKYNLHYFDWLCSTTSLELKIKTLNSWQMHYEKSPEFCAAPYPTSLRIVNWIKFGIQYTKLPDNLISILAKDVYWLSKNIEFHILANHLFANGKALIFAGCFFCHTQSKNWLKLGTSILLSELDEQINEDGGHFELSPMYHAIILEDCLDILNLDYVYPNTIDPRLIRKLKFTTKKMLDWLKLVIFPSGRFPHFNDSTQNIASSLVQLTEYAYKNNLIKNDCIDTASDGKLKLLHSSGIFILHNQTYKIIGDVGNVGPRYQPGHAHADTLSFEVSCFGVDFIVNRGISTYKKGKTRDDERGTKSHNSILINGENSSEVWSGFRVGKRATPCNLKIKENKSIECCHNGYSKFFRKILHCRKWTFSRHQIIINDKLTGYHEHNALAHLYIHPQWEVTDKTTHFECVCGTITAKITFENALGTLKHSAYNIGFNKKIDCFMIELQIEGNKLKTKIDWL